MAFPSVQNSTNKTVCWEQFKHKQFWDTIDCGFNKKSPRYGSWTAGYVPIKIPHAEQSQAVASDPTGEALSAAVGGFAPALLLALGLAFALPFAVRRKACAAA